jgi:hypothetical protein
LFTNIGVSLTSFFTGGHTWNKVEILGDAAAGNLDFRDVGATITEVKINSPRTVLFEDSASVFNITRLVTTARAGSLVTIKSRTGAAVARIASTNTMIDLNFCTIQDMTVSGAAAWYAGWNSTDGGNNLGWQRVAGGTAFNSPGSMSF